MHLGHAVSEQRIVCSDLCLPTPLCTLKELVLWCSHPFVCPHRADCPQECHVKQLWCRPRSAPDGPATPETSTPLPGKLPYRIVVAGVPSLSHPPPTHTDPQSPGNNSMGDAALFMQPAGSAGLSTSGRSVATFLIRYSGSEVGVHGHKSLPEFVFSI